MNEFKPGDVVVHPEYGRGIVQQTREGGPLWLEFELGEGALSLVSDNAPDLRRLVVIDPEDREQVERLAKTHLFITSVIGWDKLHPNLRRDLADAMKTALREFANPKPPRIEEPGTWGVVEASCVHSDIRRPWVKHPDGNWWPSWDHGQRPERTSLSDDWDSLVDPILIREGVQP